jgi:hypothetical protein
MDTLSYTTIKTMPDDSLIAAIDNHLNASASAPAEEQGFLMGRAQLLSQELSNRTLEKQAVTTTRNFYIVLGFLVLITVIAVVNLQSSSHSNNRHPNPAGGKKH